MTDLERIKFMQDCNWKPAGQYWRELYERSQATVAKQAEELVELKHYIKQLEK